MRTDHRKLPFTISVDNNAAYPEVFTASQKYLNNNIEQDHRFVKKRVRACLDHRSFGTAERTIQGVEAMNMIRKGQLRRIERDDAQGQAKFVASLFQTAA